MEDMQDEIGTVTSAEQEITENKSATASAQTERPILRVEHLKKYFPISTNFFGKPLRYLKAVDDITFNLNYGKTIGIVGESGCGKTTLGRTILKLYESDGGKIYFMDNDITDLKKNQMMKYRTDIQLIFQDPYSSLPPRMTVGAIIAEPVRVHKIVPKEEVYEYVLDIMKKCGLKPSYYDRYPHEFSGGQRQRICIARALAVKPKLVICDEPVSALDVSIQAQIINLLKDLQKTIGLTYVFISHDLSVVKYITDNILVMYLGNAMEMSETEELFDNPLHPYTQALFSAVPAPNPSVKMNRIMLEGDIPSPANPPDGCKFHTRCSKCMKVCKFMIPEYTEVKPDHFVACHLYNEQIMSHLDEYDAEYDRLEEQKRIAIELAAQNKRGKKSPAPPPVQPAEEKADTEPQVKSEPLNLSVNDTMSEVIGTEATEPQAEPATEAPTTEAQTAPVTEQSASEPAAAESVGETSAPTQTPAEETDGHAEQAATDAETETAPAEGPAATKKSSGKSTRKTTVEPTITIVTKPAAAKKTTTAKKTTATSKTTTAKKTTPKSTGTAKSTTAKTTASSKTTTAKKTTTSSKTTAAKTTATKTTGTAKSTTSSKATGTAAATKPKTTKSSSSAKPKTAKSTGTAKSANKTEQTGEAPSEDKT